MIRGTPFYAGLTKSQLKLAIREEISNFVHGEIFESSLISGLIAEKHYYCARKGLRPDSFRKQYRSGGAYDFEGYFSGHGWHMVSWMQCIDPREEDDWLVRALRDVIQPIIAHYKDLHTCCEICGAKTEEVDHVAPEFREMASHAISLLNEEQRKLAFDSFDWWSPEPFTLAPSNPAVQSIKAAHAGALLRAVCRGCHLKSAHDRREEARRR